MKIKKLLILAIALTMCLCLVFATVGCFDADDSGGNESIESVESGSGNSAEEPSSDSEENEVEITLSKTATVAEFESITLTPVIKGEGEAVWTSSAPEIATVNGGVVYGVKAGKATIKIAIGKVEASCEVTVTPTRYAHEIALSSENVTISKGKESKVKASVTFNGNPLETEGLTYTWTPVGNAADYATVTPNEDGSAVTVNGIAVGVAQFDVATVVRGYEAYERLTVNVIDNVIILDFENDKLQVGDGVYTLGLTLGSDETSTLEIGTANILVDGELKGEATINWTSENSAVVSVENGIITAHKAGYTLISGECVYDGKTLTAQIGVTAAKGERTLENVGMVIETAADNAIEIPEGVTGNVEKITVSGKTVYDGATEITDGMATIIENSMPSDVKDLGEGKTVVIETETIIYTMQADVYTLIIDSKEELDKWQEIACGEAVKVGLCEESKYGQFMTGYFILGSDITYNGKYTTYKTFMDFGNLYNWGKEWGDGSSFGFKGIFDGKGHVIDGLAVSGKYNGFVTTLADGTIRNVAFTNAEVSDTASLIARAGFGTIENIYVSYAKITGGTGENVSTVFGSYDFTSRKIENLIIDVTYCDFGSEVKDIWLVGGGYGTLKNVAVIGRYAVNVENKAFVTDVDVSDANYLVHSNSYAELFANETTKANFATLDESFWTVNDEIILPKSVAEIHKNDEIAITNTETEINKNSGLTLKAAGKYYMFVLKNEVNGVLLEGNVLKVDETATIGDEITVVVESLVSGKTSEYTLTIAKLRQTAELTERHTLDLDLSVENGALKAGDLVLDLSEGAEYIGNNRIIVKYGDAVLYDGEGANEVTVSADAVKGIFGEKNFTVLVYGAEVDYELALPVNIISKTIKTKADLDGWQEIASYVAVEANLCPAAAFRQYMTGYFVLGADISYNANFVPFTPFSTYWSLGNNGVNGVKYGSGEWTDGNSYGFKGIFDGCGYNIDGMGISGDLSGFILTFAGGTFKNVSFTNAKLSGSSSLIVKAGIGTIENVFVQYSSIVSTNDAGTFFSTGNDSARSVKNCIIDVTDCKFESATNVKLIGADAQHGEEKVVYDGVYVVGTYPSNLTLKDQKADCCAIGAFGTYAELLADETAAAKIAAFDTSVWAKNENLVIFKRLFDADNVTPAITNEEAEIIKGISVKLTSNAKYVKYSLDGEIEGVSVNGNILSVAEDVADETKITVVVISLVNGESSNFTFTVKSAGNAYVIGTPIDMDGVTLGSLDGFGLASFWARDVLDSAEGVTGYNGKVARFRNYNGEIYGDMYAHGASVSLNDSLTVKDGMNYVRVRFYVSYSAAESLNFRFYRSDRTSHEVETGVWFDYTADVATNGWINVYLPVSKFAVDGQINGFKFGCLSNTGDNAEIYIDDITIVTENYALGEEIDMTNENVNTSALSVGGMWDMPAAFIKSGAEGYIDGGSGNELKLTLNSNNFNSGITLNLANPIAVKEQMKYICMRVYVKSSLSEVTLHFDNVNVTTNDNYWNKPANQVTVATNRWVNIYLGINEYMNDGKFSSIKILNRTIDGISGTEYYIDYITITDTMGTAINLKGSQVVYPSYGNQWCDGMTAENSFIELSGGQPFACARINFAQSYTVTSETKIILRIKVSASLNGGFVAIFKRGEEGNDKWQEYRDYSVGEYATVEYDLSKFTENGELKGISFGLFGSGTIAVGTTLYIESISVL